MRIRYRRSAQKHTSTRVIDPYGLVANSGRWYLVADDRGPGRLFSVERLSAFEPLNVPAPLRPGRPRLPRWAALHGRHGATGRRSVTARLRESRLDLARRIPGSRIHDLSGAEAGWCTIVVRSSDIESVRQLLQFGDHIEILAPDAARDRIRQLAEDLVERHTTPPS